MMQHSIPDKFNRRILGRSMFDRLLTLHERKGRLNYTVIKLSTDSLLELNF